MLRMKRAVDIRLIFSMTDSLHFVTYVEFLGMMKSITN